ncbi:GIY-YIG nuclease family protein [Kitasatospora sp. NPDC094016]|uniref:GIY-YIG nuclease family protein n=1 Tax=Kitasatospora sp. NPDC094016 TaxID=3154986 RepID=UPI003323411C
MNEQDVVETTPSIKRIVYAIGSSASTLVKIGITKNLSRRLLQIRTMSPLLLSVIWQHETEDLQLENKLHRHFADRRKHGEWFDFGGLTADQALDGAVLHLEASLPVQRSDEPVEHPEAPGLDNNSPDCNCGHSVLRHSGPNVINDPPYLCAAIVEYGFDCICMGYDPEPMTMEKWSQTGIWADYAVYHPAFRPKEVRLASPLRPALARLMPGDPSAHPEGRTLVLRDVGLYLTALNLIEANGSTSAPEVVEAIGGRLPIEAVRAELDALLEQDLLCQVPNPG